MQHYSMGTAIIAPQLPNIHNHSHSHSHSLKFSLCISAWISAQISARISAWILVWISAWISPGHFSLHSSLNFSPNSLNFIQNVTRTADCWPLTTAYCWLPATTANWRPTADHQPLTALPFSVASCPTYTTNQSLFPLGMWLPRSVVGGSILYYILLAPVLLGS